MKNLANCSGVEFLRQTNKIRHSVEGWLKMTSILEIRKNKAKLTPITKEMSKEEIDAVKEENAIVTRAQVKKNLSDMLDAALDANAEKTYEILCMMCFIEPQDAKTVKPPVLLENFAEMISDESVIRFFTSLMKLEGILT